MIHINKEVCKSRVFPDIVYYDVRKIAPRQHSCNDITHISLVPGRHCWGCIT